MNGVIKYVDGDLIKLAKEGKFDVICHGANCQSVMKSGIAPQMAKAFGCDKFKMELIGPDVNKLGNIDYQTLVLGENSIWSLEDAKNNKNEPELTVVNAYTQYRYGKNHKDGDSMPFDYQAFTVCMRKINATFPGKHVGMPYIGCGLAGGDWKRIERIIVEELWNCKVTIVNYKKMSLDEIMREAYSNKLM
jgi:O-acetyl-ADP-ribose deacetylase (regulator of RNase III)